MATVADAMRRDGSVPLIEGVNMRCPRCRELNNILRFVPMGQIREFVAETMPVYKCPACRWIFAPAPHVLEDIRAMAADDDQQVTLSDETFASLAEIHFTGTETREDGGFVVKDILRTGEWPVIPTRGGTVKKPLKIVRSGQSNKDEGIISLEELVANFKAGAIQNPQIPLSDDDDDHKNITAVNTGFVRDLWIVDDGDVSRLFAKFDFTEPDVKEKALRGTYADVSCGIPWEVTSRGQNFGTTLEHVAITNRPFIDGLGPFIALSQPKKDDKEIVHFSTAEVVEQLGSQTPPPADPPADDPELTVQQIIESAQETLGIYSGDYEVEAITKDGFEVKSASKDKTWTVPFVIKGGKPRLAGPDEWVSVSKGEAPAPGEQKPPAPDQPSAHQSLTGPDAELEAARRLREQRLTASNHTTTEGDNMPLSREELERLDLSAMPEEQKAVFQKILDENVSLSAKTREGEVDRRIAELEGLGLKERPGFLKLYRQVALADDGGPAAVVLSENGQKEPVGAQAILDRAIDALTMDGKVVLSDQQLSSGNDIKPPVTPEGETKPLADRVAEARAELGLATK